MMLDAISKGNWPLIRFHIWEGENPDILKNTKWYEEALTERLNAMLISAIAQDDYVAINELIAKGADVNVDARIDDWMTPIITASRCAGRNTIRLLLSKGADANKESGYPVGMSGYITHSSALLWAVRRGSVEIIDELLDAHSNPNAQEVSLVSNSDKSTREQLDRTPLLEDPSMDIIKKLVEHGANPNQSDFAGMTPLMIAANMGELRKCEFLLNSGVECTPRMRQ